ncbi:MAG: hypothetical protein IJ848_01700 [Alphaproteobacteria bacterium]|nr:hypothetical protein [Alphaproteobacteria bacterium]
MLKFYKSLVLVMIGISASYSMERNELNQFYSTNKNYINNSNVEDYNNKFLQKKRNKSNNEKSESQSETKTTSNNQKTHSNVFVNNNHVVIQLIDDEDPYDRSIDIEENNNIIKPIPSYTAKTIIHCELSNNNVSFHTTIKEMHNIVRDMLKRYNVFVPYTVKNNIIINCQDY